MRKTFMRRLHVLAAVSMFAAAMFTVAVLTVASAQAPLAVRIGFYPTPNADLLTTAADAVARDLEAQLAGAVAVEVVLPAMERELIEAMGSGDLDFAFLTPGGLVAAHQEGGAMVLLKAVRGGNPYYWSAIVVRRDSGLTTVGDLEGRSIAWIAPNSEAGYLFPRSELIRAGIDPDTFFADQTFAGGHDAAVLAVADGSVDAAATFANDDQNVSGAWTQFLEPERASRLTAIFYSRPIPGDAFGVSRAFAASHPALTYRVAAAVASLRAPESALLRDLYRIDAMVPADSADYAVVRDARQMPGPDEPR